MRTFCILASLATLCASLLFALFPQHRVEFVGEDRTLENITVGLYGLAVVVALVAMIRRSLSRATVMAAGFIALAATLGAMEELSWGERYFELEAPVLFGVKIDAIHDLLHAAIKRIKVLLTSSTIARVAFVAAGLACAWTLVRTRARIALQAARVYRHPAGRFIMITAALGIFALFLDLVNDAQKNHDLPLQGPVQLGEELCECLAALSLVFGAVTQIRR